MDNLGQVTMTASFVKAGATAGTTTTVTTTATVQYWIKGKSYSKAALTNQAFPSTDAMTAAAFKAIAASQACALVLGFNSSGTLQAVQGPAVNLDACNNFNQAPELPMVPDTMCPFAYVICKNGSTGSSWTPGTSNWTATGMTATFVDIGMFPDRPQTS